MDLYKPGFYLIDNVDVRLKPTLQTKEFPICKSNGPHNDHSKHIGVDLWHCVALLDFIS